MSTTTHQQPLKPDRYKASSLRAYNGRLASQYDRSFVVRALRVPAMDDFVLDALGGAVGRRAILDVGCGTGRLLERLAQAGARELAGTDLAPRMLDVARDRLRESGVRVELRAADTETSLPWQSDTFDVVTMTGVFHHFTDPGAALGEVRRILRGDGRLLIVDPCFFTPLREIFNLLLRIHPRDGDYRFYSPSLMMRLLTAHAWQIDRCERVNWWAFGIVARPRPAPEADSASGPVVTQRSGPPPRPAGA